MEAWFSEVPQTYSNLFDLQGFQNWSSFMDNSVSGFQFLWLNLRGKRSTEAVLVMRDDRSLSQTASLDEL